MFYWTFNHTEIKLCQSLREFRNRFKIISVTLNVFEKNMHELQ